MTMSIAPNPYQQAVLRFRAQANIAQLGGRGSSKTFALCLDCVTRCAEDPNERPLVLRESWSGTQQITDLLFTMATAAFHPQKVRTNSAMGEIICPNGAVITVSNVGDAASYAKHQGKTYTSLFADEMGNYPPTAFAFAMRCRSNLRVPVGKRAHIHITANPHGAAHTLCVQKFMKHAPGWWKPYREDGTEDGEWWVNAGSTLKDNPHIDQRAYEVQLRKATGHNDALAKAWIENDWSVMGGSMFDNFDPAFHVRFPPPARMRYQLGADWGTASPSTCILLGRLLDHAGPFVPGDMFAIDEVDTAVNADDLSTGTGAPPSEFAEMVMRMLQRHRCKKSTPMVCDDMRGLMGDTVCAQLSKEGLWCSKPIKTDRAGGFQLVRTYLHHAKTGAGPGLWVSPDCRNLITTLPMCPRDPLRPEVIDTRFTMRHWADGLIYGLKEMHHTGRGGNGRTVGHY